MESRKIISGMKIAFVLIMLLLLIKITTPAKTVNGQAPFTVNFIGSAISTDLTVSYYWDFDDGTTSSEQNPSHTYADEGIYHAVLTVTNSNGRTAKDEVIVVVSAANAPPIASAGQDKSSAVSAITQLDGSQSYDPEGAQLSYNWMQISGTSAALSSTTVQKPSFTAIQEGTYEFQLTVYDGELYSQPDTVTITINPNPPEITNVQVTPLASSSGTMFEITATVVDNTQSGVDVAVDINSPRLADDLVLSNQGGNEYMTVWDSANAPSGVHTAEATATSNSPVLSATASAPFSINPEATECTVATSCEEDQTCIFSMNAETNSHASQSCDAAYKVCCSSSKFTSNSCGTRILKLTSASNAHAAEPDAAVDAYSTNVCVSPDTTQCAYRDGACNSDEICVASLFQATASPVYNTHVARCDFYSLKICCKNSVQPPTDITIEGEYTGFYNFPTGFFEESDITKEQVVKVTDAQYLSLKQMHNELSPYTFAKIEYQPEDYGSTTPDGIKLGDSAFPNLNSGHHRWEVMAHEQGHNFFGGTSAFYGTLAFPYPFLQESLAVLSAFYTYHNILENQETYGIDDDAIDSLNFDFTNGRAYQESMYDQYVSEGKNFDINQVLTSQALDYKMIVYGETYGWQEYTKFAKAFENEIGQQFTFQNDGVSDIEQSTYVIAALSVAFGVDFRQDFIDLNFPVDDALYTEFYDKISGFV